MLSNKTRNKIKEHFDKHIEDDTYQEKYEKDFTNEDEEVQEFANMVNNDNYQEFNKVTNYRYVGDELLDLNDNTFTGDISIIMYTVNDHLFKPFLMFFLEKKDNKLIIPQIKASNSLKANDVKNKIESVLPRDNYDLHYQGFYDNDGEVFLFFKMNVEYKPIYFSSDEKYFFTTVHEMINLKEVYQIPVDDHAVDFLLRIIIFVI